MNKPEWPMLAGGSDSTAGVLIDREISAAVSKGQLISSSLIPDAAKYASYEMHIGTHIQQLVLDDTPGPESDLYRVKKIVDESFQINPNETFKIYAAEELYMPSDVFAITIPVGNMFKLGLNPETSFADPGFSGQFYVTVCNYSQRVVHLRVGDSLARVFFFKLSSRPTIIHDTKPRELPPAISRMARPDFESLIKRGEKDVLSEVLKSVDPPHYEHAFVTERMFLHHRSDDDRRMEQIKKSQMYLLMSVDRSLGARFSRLVSCSDC